MRLNAEEMSVMEEVRDIMQMDSVSDCTLLDVSHYICTNVAYVLLCREGKGANDPIRNLSDEGLEIFSEITRAISQALSLLSTLGFWMSKEIEGVAFLPTHRYCDVVSLARLAWLDKIIETGVIE